MLEILQYIFGSFWRWLGTVMLVMAFASAIGSTFIVIRGAKFYKSE